MLLILSVLTLFGCLRVRELRDGQKAVSALRLQLKNDDLISNDATCDSQNCYLKNCKHDSLYLEASSHTKGGTPKGKVCNEYLNPFSFLATETTDWWSTSELRKYECTYKKNPVNNSMLFCGTGYVLFKQFHVIAGGTRVEVLTRYSLFCMSLPKLPVSVGYVFRVYKIHKTSFCLSQ